MFFFSLPADFTPICTKDRMEGHDAGAECEEWFFCTKAIPAEDVEAAIAHGKRA